jgi:hypothetical protein
VIAGEQLVHQCPTWQWASGDESKLKHYLPKDKQFLVTRNGIQFLIKSKFILFNQLI